jgi:hypothetical protein
VVCSVDDPVQLHDPACLEHLPGEADLRIDVRVFLEPNGHLQAHLGSRLGHFEGLFPSDRGSDVSEPYGQVRKGADDLLQGERVGKLGVEYRQRVARMK